MARWSKIQLFVVGSIFFLISLCFAFSSVKAFAATGDITGMRIVGATTTVADATSASNAASSTTGWVLEIDFSGMATSGIYSLGIGVNNDATNAKIVCTATSLGYDTSGNATTVVRTIYGTHQLRKVYNAAYTAPYPNDETLVSGTLTTRIALSNFVYASDTNVSCTVGAGIYNDGTHSSNAVSGFAVTNNSILAYPRVIANWSWPGWSRINSSLDGDGTNHSDGSFTVRAVGYHQSAKNGKPLAAIVFTATDQHDHTATQTVTDMTIDSTMTDASKVQEYVATFSSAQVATFTQGDLITVNFKAYPWFGDSGAVMDTSDGVNSQPTPLYAPIYFINDRLGTFGTAAAVVAASGGDDATCVAVSETVFNANPNSNAANTFPCATVNKAITIIRAWNAASSSPARTDEAGTVWMKAGTYTWTGASVAIGSNSGTNPSKTWLTVTPFPGVAKSDVVINGITSTTYNKTGDSPLKISGLTVNVTSGAPVEIFNASTATDYLWLDNNNLTMTSGTTLAYNFGSVYWTRNTAGGAVANGLAVYGSKGPPVLIRGNVLDGLNNQVNVYTMIGNLFAGSGTSFGITMIETAAPIASNQPILAYNKLMNLKRAGPPILIFQTLSSPIGFADIQNLIEYNAFGSQPLTSIANDSSTNTPVNNVLLWHNTFVGQRTNMCYNDNGSTLRLRTLWSDIGNVYDSTAIKSDTFNVGNAARVGNWACEYGVGFKNRVDAESGTVSNPVGVASQFQAEFTGLNSKFASPGATQDAQASNEPPANSSWMHAVSWLGYVNRAAWDGVNVGVGSGDYHLTAGSPALNMIPSSQAVLPYDLDGNARNNNGTGAAGAYEYITSPTVTTNAASSVASSSATLSGTITVTGGTDATQSGFAYATSSDLSTGVATSTLGAQSGAATFIQAISGLNCNTAYYVRAYATNGQGTGFGSIVPFTTSACVDTTPPTPGSLVFSTVTATSITASSTGASDAVALATLPFLYHATSTSYNQYQGPTSTAVAFTGLTPNRMYYFEVGVQDAAGNSATTTPAATTTLANPPATLILTPNQAAIATSWSANSNPVGTEYYAENLTASTNSGWTTATSWNSTGLAANTSYIIQVKARNSAGSVTSAISLATTTTAAPTPTQTATTSGGATAARRAAFAVQNTGPGMSITATVPIPAAKEEVVRQLQIELLGLLQQLFRLLQAR